MYSEMSTIPESLKPVSEKFRGHIEAAGLSAVSTFIERLLATEDKLKPDPTAYINILLEVYGKYLEITNRIFQRDQEFLTSLDKACEEFINHNAAADAIRNGSPGLLARHLDRLLRKSRHASGDDFERSLDQAIIIFRFLSDKEAFRTLYRSRLHLRLIHGVPISREEKVVSKLTLEMEPYGSAYTQPLEQILSDARKSEDLTNSFANWVQQHKSDADIPTNALVFPLGKDKEYWLRSPSAVAPDFVIPPVLLPTYEKLETYYGSQHSGRKLTLLWNSSRNEVRTNYLHREYTFIVATFHMAILLQYNAHESLSVGDLIKSTGIVEGYLIQVLSYLVKWNILIHDKESKRYGLNMAFTAPATRCNFYAPMTIEADEEAARLEQKIADDRKYEIQSIVYSLVRRRPNIPHQTLICESVHALSQKRTPKIPEIKKAIEVLIEKEYIERVDNKTGIVMYQKIA
ncbi:Cullin-domain-containing protein [Pluteus cervinus]|uniref:Cullin-domain-containing protein n=1 Tax=Pluteus cervinus TaxID=181527 RepID=A0ACD3AK73_9AGAR|nr:Cullin-domain-containing protein [Pluteus cervinus]